MTLIVKQRDDFSLTTAGVTGLISEHEVDFGQAYAATPGRPVPIRADTNPAQIGVACPETSSAFCAATPQASRR
jgi:hypothetical protein